MHSVVVGDLCLGTLVNLGHLRQSHHSECILLWSFSMVWARGMWRAPPLTRILLSLCDIGKVVEDADEMGRRGGKGMHRDLSRRWTGAQRRSTSVPLSSTSTKGSRTTLALPERAQDERAEHFFFLCGASLYHCFLQSLRIYTSITATHALLTHFASRRPGPYLVGWPDAHSLRGFSTKLSSPKFPAIQLPPLLRGPFPPHNLDSQNTRARPETDYRNQHSTFTVGISVDGFRLWPLLGRRCVSR
ncbi:hypothetical protein C8R47DRAFT_424272 [Mycena vitilis]|nr:hypothetical protein C8R47DRAFT_424272 [Mycena vitilis]